MPPFGHWVDDVFPIIRQRIVDGSGSSWQVRRAHERGDETAQCDTEPDMGDVHEVRIARRTGFCYGVREAIDDARIAAAAGKPTHTLGQVVHNEGVIRSSGAGHRAVDSLDDVEDGRRGRHPRPRRDARRHGSRGEQGPRGHRRHLHLGHPGAEGAREARRGGLHDRPARHAQAPRGRRAARLRARRDPRRRGGGLGAASRDASGWRSSPSALSRPGSSSGSPPSWSPGRTSSRSSTRSAR